MQKWSHECNVCMAHKHLDGYLLARLINLSGKLQGAHVAHARLIILPN